MKWPLDRWDTLGATGMILAITGVSLCHLPAALMLAGAALTLIGIGGAQWVSSRR